MNSFYGRFAMKTDLSVHKIIHNEALNTLYESNHIKPEDVLFNIPLGDNNSFISYKSNQNSQYLPNINISVALAVTSYARVYMGQFKNNPDLTGNLYYSDTDSIFTSKPLSKNWVDGKILGKLKLEHVLSKFISLGPKVYGGITNDGIQFTKVKGLKNKIKFSLLESLLIKDNTSILYNEKWFKSFEKSQISILDTKYTLSPTENKRHLVYINNILDSTKNRF